MDSNDLFIIALGQLVWALPALITLTVVSVVAVVRRDGGTWWKLVLGGASVLVVGQLVGTVGALVGHSLVHYRAAYAITGGVGVLCNVVGLGLLGAGAIVGRRPRA